MEAPAGYLDTVFKNRVLDGLPPAELERLWPNLIRVRLAFGQELHGPSEPLRQVFFLESGFMSMVAQADGPDDLVEVGLVGPESMVGLAALFSKDAITYNQGVIQAAGTAYAMSLDAFRASIEQSPSLRRLLNQAMELSIA